MFVFRGCSSPISAARDPESKTADRGTLGRVRLPPPPPLSCPIPLTWAGGVHLSLGCGTGAAASCAGLRSRFISCCSCCDFSVGPCPPSSHGSPRRALNVCSELASAAPLEGCHVWVWTPLSPAPPLGFLRRHRVLLSFGPSGRCSGRCVLACGLSAGGRAGRRAVCGQGLL